MYAVARDTPDAFWLDQAQRLDWVEAPTQTGDWSFEADDFHIRWFADGTLNASANCFDRYLAIRGDSLALIWEPDGAAEEPRRFAVFADAAEPLRTARAMRPRCEPERNSDEV